MKHKLQHQKPSRPRIASCNKQRCLSALISLLMLFYGLSQSAAAQDNWTTLPSATTTNLYTPTDDSQQKVEIVQNLLSAPLLFEKNEGQVDDRVKYLARSAGGVMYFFTEEGVTMLLQSQEQRAESFGSQRDKLRAESPDNIGKYGAENLESRLRREAESHDKFEKKREIKSHALKVTFIGSNPNPQITAEEQTQTITNYFIGNDPTKWRSGVGNYTKIRYHNVYDGIDIVYYGNGRQLEYDFVVHPGADPNVIRINYEGSEEPLRIDDEGNVVIATSVGLLHEKKPYSYQSKIPAPARTALSGWRTTDIVQSGGSNLHS